MASNVFGIPVTDATLKAMPEFIGVDITRRDRARVAMDLKNAQSKDVNVRQYVENLKRQWGTGVSTLCVIYNATGDPLQFAGSRDWYGQMGPAPVPRTIQNGQWGGFLHVKKTAAPSGSLGAVVYRGRNGNDRMCDWMAAWNNPWNKSGFSNSSYTRIRNSGYFNDTTWKDVIRCLKVGLTAATNGRDAFQLLQLAAALPLFSRPFSP